MSFFVVLYKQLLFNVLFCYIVGTNVGFFSVLLTFFLNFFIIQKKGDNFLRFKHVCFIVSTTDHHSLYL